MEEKEDEEEDDDGEEKKEMKEKKEERERNARQSLPRFFREITVGRPTKGISILNPIGGYARPFHLFATGPKLVPSSLLENSSSLSLSLPLSLFLSIQQVQKKKKSSYTNPKVVIRG